MLINPLVALSIALQKSDSQHVLGPQVQQERILDIALCAQCIRAAVPQTLCGRHPVLGRSLYVGSDRGEMMYIPCLRPRV